MKAILMRPKPNAAFKVVQPLPVLPNILRAKPGAAAPQIDAAWRMTEPTRNPTCAVALGAAENTVREKRGRGLSAAAALAGIAQSCVAMAELPARRELSRGLETRLMG